MAGVSSSNAVEMLRSGKYSDFTIICKDKQFKVHKVILCAESEFFEKCCEGKFSEGSDKVEFADDDPETIQLMLEHLYCGRYLKDSFCGCEAYAAQDIAMDDAGPGPSTKRAKDITSEDQATRHVLLVNLHVYIFADRLNLMSLKMYARDIFFHKAETALSKPFFADVLQEIFQKAPYDDENDLRRQIMVKCFDFFGKIEFNTAVRDVFQNEEPLALKYAAESYQRIVEMTSVKAQLAEASAKAKAATSMLQSLGLTEAFADATAYFTKTQRCSSCKTRMYEGGPWPRMLWDGTGNYRGGDRQPSIYCQQKNCGVRMTFG